MARRIAPMSQKAATAYVKAVKAGVESLDTDELEQQQDTGVPIWQASSPGSTAAPAQNAGTARLQHRSVAAWQQNGATTAVEEESAYVVAPGGTVTCEYCEQEFLLMHLSDDTHRVEPQRSP
jgi:hypothetical protein